MAMDLADFASTVRARAADWEALGVAVTIAPISPNHGKPVVLADFEGAGHLAEVIMWITGETELETARVSDGRIVNCHYEVTSTEALSGVLDDLVSSLRAGAVPKNGFVAWHDVGNGEASR